MVNVLNLLAQRYINCADKLYAFLYIFMKSLLILFFLKFKSLLQQVNAMINLTTPCHFLVVSP